MPDIKSLLVRFRHVDEVLKQATDDRKEVQSQVIDLMQTEGFKTATVHDGPDDITGTFVQSSTIVIDEARLKKALGAKQFDKLCSLSLDKAKLEEAIARKEVDPVTVAACSTEQPRAPYVRLTVKKGVRKADVTVGKRQPSRGARKHGTVKR